MGADFDRIAVQHDCPRCSNPLPGYQTSQLRGEMRVYKLGDTVHAVDPSDLSRTERPGFEFRVLDYCNQCATTVEGVGIVLRNVLWGVRETGYRDERAEPIVH